MTRPELRRRRLLETIRRSIPPTSRSKAIPPKIKPKIRDWLSLPPEPVVTDPVRTSGAGVAEAVLVVTEPPGAGTTVVPLWTAKTFPLTQEHVTDVGEAAVDVQREESQSDPVHATQETGAEPAAAASRDLN